MRRPRPSFAALLFFGLALSCARLSDSGARDVLLITVDTLRADHLGCYGYPTARTPTIDRFASEGLLFERAYTSIPRTTPGLASLLTGLEPSRHGSREVGQPVRGGTLLSEALAARGWATAAVTASVVAGPAENLARGFERFEVLPRAPAETVTARALAVAAALPADRPRFLWVHYFDTHTPYEPPAPWGDALAGGPCQRLREEHDRGEVALGLIFSDHEGIASRVRNSCTRLYDAEIAYTDDQIGRLLAGLAAILDLDRGIAVLTSDHGENLSEDGLFFEHGPSLHESALRVPLVVRGPGFPAGRRNDPASLTDVAPTLLDALGFDGAVRAGMDGVSLRSRTPRRVLLAEAGSALHVHQFTQLHSGRREDLHCLNGERYSLCGRPGEPPALYDHLADPGLRAPLTATQPEIAERLGRAREIWPPEEVRRRTALLGTLKLVAEPRLDGGYASRLVDLAADPAETADARDRFPERYDELRRALAAWPASLPETPPPPRADEEVQRLRSLGYAGGAGRVAGWPPRTLARALPPLPGVDPATATARDDPRFADWLERAADSPTLIEARPAASRDQERAQLPVPRGSRG